MKTVVIVQARMGSTRLPGKVMLPLAGEPVLWHVLTRCGRIGWADAVVCVAPDLPESRPIVELADSLDIPCYLGHPTDLLDRYYHAARWAKADIVVRITSDCPLIDPVVCDRVIRLLRSSHLDYASNVMPRGYPKGLDCEAFTFGLLERAYRLAEEPYDREHVGPWMQRNGYLANLPGPGRTDERLVIDTAEDYENLERIVEERAA